MDEIRTKEEHELRKALLEAVRAAYQSGRQPDQPDRAGYARIAFNRALDAAMRYIKVARRETELADKTARLVVIKNALARPEAKPSSREFLTWISAAQYFAHELGLDWPPYPEDRTMSQSDINRRSAQGRAPPKRMRT